MAFIRRVLHLALVLGASSAADNNAMHLSPETIRKIHQKIDKDGKGKVSMSEVLSFCEETNRLIAAKGLDMILKGVDCA